jgi:hypothetical protein
VRFGALAFAALGLILLAHYSTHITRHVYVGLALSSIAAAVWYLIEMRNRPNAKGSISVQRYQNEYVGSFIIVMAIASVLPSIWLATDYHDVSLQAFLRSELSQAAEDIERRHAIIARDLQRWVPLDEQRQRYPDPWTLSAVLQVPGYHIDPSPTGQPVVDKHCETWILDAFASMPWINASGPPSLGIIRRMIWAAATQSNAPRRSTPAAYRSSLLPQVARGASEQRCPSEPETVIARLRSGDGTRIRVQANYFGDPSVPTAGNDMDSLRIDGDLKWSSSARMISAFAAIVFGLMLVLILLAWTVSRRLLGIRIPFASRFVSATPDRMAVGPLLDEEFKIIELEKRYPQEFTLKDASDWRAVHCKEQYKAMWISLQDEERLLLHQLAKGRFANPENQAVIERLVHLGFLKLQPWARIADTGFAHYARTAETEQQFATWQREASKNVWNRIRTPLLIVVLVVAAAMMWLAGSTMQILSATLAGMATIFGYVTQVTNFVRKDSKPLGG